MFYGCHEIVGFEDAEPTFGFSGEEIETAVAYFHALEPEEFAARPESPPEAGRVAAGGEVFALLQCARCHPAGAEAAAALDVAAANLAPSKGWSPAGCWRPS